MNAMGRSSAPSGGVDIIVNVVIREAFLIFVFVIDSLYLHSFTASKYVVQGIVRFEWVLPKRCLERASGCSVR